MWFLSKLVAFLLAAAGVLVTAMGILAESDGKMIGVGLVLLLGAFVFALLAFASRPRAPAGRP